MSSKRLKLRVRGNFGSMQQRLKRSTNALNATRRVHDQALGHRGHEVWNINDFRGISSISAFFNPLANTARGATGQQANALYWQKARANSRRRQRANKFQITRARAPAFHQTAHTPRFIHRHQRPIRAAHQHRVGVDMFARQQRGLGGKNFVEHAKIGDATARACITPRARRLNVPMPGTER